MKTLSLHIRHALWLLTLLPVLVFSADDGTVTLHLTPADIEAMEISESTIWLKLTPSATSRLRTVTEQSYGQTLEVDLEGVPLLQTRVFATVESGVLQLNSPSADVTRRLERLQQHRRNEVHR